jgi:hypothetical protein
MMSQGHTRWRIWIGLLGCGAGLAAPGCETYLGRPVEREMVIERTAATTMPAASAPPARAPVIVREYDVVSAPPPPPPAEIITVRPTPWAVWVPGYWVPARHRWVWVRGHWR